jgi:hypothetical protein
MDHDTRVLRDLQQDYPHFVIWREATPGGVHYHARSTDLSNHPHTVVTTDLNELRDTLRHATRHGQSPPAESPKTSLA